eukprot:jgi/Botrbrau1/14356/Bobra.0014s0011.1
MGRPSIVRLPSRGAHQVHDTCSNKTSSGFLEDR